MLVDIAYLVPSRARDDPNTLMEMEALRAVGHTVSVTDAPSRAPLGTLRLLALAPRIARTKPDVVMARDLDTLWPAARVKQLSGSKLLYWPHDCYSWMVESDVPRFIYSQTVHHERALLKFVNHIIISNLGTENWLHAQYLQAGEPRPDATLVMPCRDPEPEWLPPSEPRTLCYLGTLHKNRFTVEMVRAMRKLKDVRLIIAGPRTNALYEWVRENRSPNMEVYGWLPGVRPTIRRSSIVVSMLNPADRCLRAGLATKVFDAMAVGRAAIGTYGTATGDLIQENQMGPDITYDEEDFVATVRWLLDEVDLGLLGRNAYDACKRKYNWRTESKKLVSVFETL